MSVVDLRPVSSSTDAVDELVALALERGADLYREAAAQARGGRPQTATRTCERARLMVAQVATIRRPKEARMVALEAQINELDVEIGMLDQAAMLGGADVFARASDVHERRQEACGKRAKAWDELRQLVGLGGE